MISQSYDSLGGFFLSRQRSLRDCVTWPERSYAFTSSPVRGSERKREREKRGMHSGTGEEIWEKEGGNNGENYVFSPGQSK